MPASEREDVSEMNAPQRSDAGVQEASAGEEKLQTIDAIITVEPTEREEESTAEAPSTEPAELEGKLTVFPPLAQASDAEKTHAENLSAGEPTLSKNALSVEASAATALADKDEVAGTPRNFIRRWFVTRSRG